MRIQVESAKASNVVAVIIKFSYGKPYAFPANEAAEKFAVIGGKQTLNLLQIEAIKSLGYEVVNVTP